MANRVSFRAKMSFYVIVIGLPFIFAECLVRIYFAIQVGPSVLLYGTMLSWHQEKFDPKGARQRAAQQDTTVAFHENVTERYSKYYPNQTRYDRDEGGHLIHVSINSRGFRGRNVKLAKDPGVIRVVTLGASSTFGFKNHDDQTYPYYLEEMLNESLAKNEANAQHRVLSGETIEAFEVINLGIPHLKSAQIAALFVSEALELQPDFVTFYEGINDAALSPPPDTSAEKTKQVVKAIPLATQVFRELRYRFLSVAFAGMMISPERDQYLGVDDVQALSQGKAAAFIASLQALYEVSRQNHIQLIIANQQATSREGRRQDRSAIHGLTYESEQAIVRERLAAVGRISAVEAYFVIHRELMEASRRWAGLNNIPYVDVIKAMNPNRQYLITWVHLNAAGNRIVAAALADAILKCISGDCGFAEASDMEQSR